MSDDLQRLITPARPQDTIAPELLVQLVRAMRIVSVHSMDNETTRTALAEFRAVLDRALGVFQSVQVQCVGDNVYFNNEFIRLKGAAFEAADQIRKLFKRVAINELAFTSSLDKETCDELFRTYQQHVQSQHPEEFANVRLARVAVRSIKETRRVGIDPKLEVARTFAQLLVLLSESLESLDADRAFPLARVRRAVQQLADAAIGHEALLAGLTRNENAPSDLAMHATSTAALVLLMGMKLGLPKKELVSTALSAAFHDFGRRRTRQAPGAPPLEDSEETRMKIALSTALDIARFTLSREALDRASIAFECAVPARGDQAGLIPGASAKLISVACAYDRLTRPMTPDGKMSPDALRPDLAVRVLLDDPHSFFDKKAVKLFTSVVGVYPVGSMVKLSNGQGAVVLSVPEDPARAARPTVKVIDPNGADYVLELDRSDVSLSIAGSLDAREQGVNVTHFLLA